MLIFNAGVSVPRVLPWMVEVLNAAADWSAVNRVDVYVVSIDDKQHEPGSLHPFGLAVDLGTAGNNRVLNGSLFAWMARHVDLTYDVLYEGDHVHVEKDYHRLTKDAAPPPA